jgi:histone H3/H4
MAKKTKKKAAKKAPAKNTKKKAAKKAGKKPAKKGGKKKPLELIISKSRTKNAAGINVSGEFYGALDAAVREIIAGAEARAMSNGRKTLRPHDL